MTKKILITGLLILLSAAANSAPLNAKELEDKCWAVVKPNVSGASVTRVTWYRTSYVTFHLSKKVGYHKRSSVICFPDSLYTDFVSEQAGRAAEKQKADEEAARKQAVGRFK